MDGNLSNVGNASYEPIMLPIMNAVHRFIMHQLLLRTCKIRSATNWQKCMLSTIVHTFCLIIKQSIK